MKVLIVENPTQHNGSIADAFKDRIMLFNGSVDIASDVFMAFKSMKINSYDFVLIHHYGFDEICFLKKIFPGSRYVAYSGASFTGYNIESIMNGFDTRLKDEYDHVVYSPSCIDSLVGGLP